MAKEEEDNQTTETAPEAAEDSQASAEGESSLMPLVIKAAVILVVAGGLGFGLGTFMNGPKKASGAEGENTAEVEQTDQASDKPYEPASESTQGKKLTYFDFQEDGKGIRANINEPRMSRHVRIVIKLGVEPEKVQDVQTLIAEKRPVLTNWLRIYLAGCTLEDLRGPKNLNRIRREICDRFNDEFWPGQKPLIHEVLFSDFMIN